MMRRVYALVLAAFLVPALVLPALADAAAVRATISGQLDAFRAGDAQAAYAFAAPQIKRMFPSAERFIAMVRRGYAPVYEARDPVFLRSQQINPNEFAQEVGLVDAGGQSWTALYTLARQDDGTWRITGCYLRRASDQTT